MMQNELHKNGNMQGFTLLELLIAISILAMGLLATAGMQSVGLNANARANRITVAAMVAQLVVEDLGSLRITDPLLHTAVTDAPYSRMFDPATSATTVGIVTLTGAGTFSAQYDVEPDTPLAGTTQITVRVFQNGSTTPVLTVSTYRRVV